VIRAPESTGGRRWVRPIVLLGLLAAAAVLTLWSPVDIPQLLEWGREATGHPLAIVLFIVVQAALLTLALPGTLVLWVVAPFHAPPVAVAILLAGSVSGALGAYAVARTAGSDWRPRHGAWLIDLVARHSDFVTQCALRILPGCPHWAINYTGGVLRLPLLSFTLAAIIGLTIKWSAYSTLIYGATTAAAAGEALDTRFLIPMAVLALLLAAGSLVYSKVVRKYAARRRR